MDDNPDGFGEPSARPGWNPPVPHPPPGWIHDQILDARAPLQISATAAASSATWARREFAGWLAVDVAAGDLFDDLVLVVYEALANTVDHAYVTTGIGTGPVELTARRSHEAIHITIADRGVWLDAPATETFRGRGLELIRLLVNEVYLELGSTGTTVHLCTALPPPIAAPP
ncbi:ATP-binding protein [Pseudonocardia sp. DLS-67]